MLMQLHQLRHTQPGEISDFRTLRLAAGDFVDAARRAMDAGGFVTFAGIAPVEHEHATIRTVTEFHAAEPGITKEQAVFSMLADVTGAGAFQDFLIRPEAVQVQRKEMSSILVGPIVTEVNHGPNVGVTAAVV